MTRMYSTAVNQVIIKEIKNSSLFLGHAKQKPQVDSSTVNYITTRLASAYDSQPRCTVSQPAWAHHAQPVTGECTRRAVADRGR